MLRRTTMVGALGLTAFLEDATHQYEDQDEDPVEDLVM